MICKMIFFLFLLLLNGGKCKVRNISEAPAILQYPYLLSWTKKKQNDIRRYNSRAAIKSFPKRTVEQSFFATVAAYIEGRKNENGRFIFPESVSI